MDLMGAEYQRRLKHRRLLYQYYRARRRDDQTTLAALRHLAETDQDLARALEQIEQALERRPSISPEQHPLNAIHEAQSIAELRPLLAEHWESATSDSTPPSHPHPDQLPAVPEARASAPGATAEMTAGANAYWYHAAQHVFAERTDADYSTTVERQLSATIGRLESRREGEWSKALEDADAILSQRMAPSQRLRALHIFATFARESRDFSRALGYMDDAVAISVRFGAPVIQVSLLYWRGRILRDMSHVRRAIEDYRIALAHYHNLPEEDRHPTSATFSIEVAILVELANMEFFLALYPAAERHAAEAAMNLPALADSAYFAGRLEWIRALQHRWRGQPELALRPAARALELLEPLGDASALARMHVVIASITLDMAERLPDGTDRLGITVLASSHFTMALQLAHESDDQQAFALAQIEDVRCGRLRGINRDRLGSLEAVSKRGQEWGDSALQAQAFTALAQEMSTRNEPERALNLYRRALTLTRKSDLPALGVWAQRALLQASEMRGTS